MCNAHNHPPNCPCNWGRGINFSYGSNSISKNNHIKENYAFKVLAVYPIYKFSETIPNAFCPVCNAKVFFYQNIYGSRVFFDSLGKPWPKHPCTDNAEYSTKNGIVGDPYQKNNFIIPKSSSEKKEITQRGIKVHSLKNSRFYKSRFGKNMLLFNGTKFMLEENFVNSPDIIIITERKGEFYIESYEILDDFNQQIKLIKKNINNIETLKHFEIDNNEILTISINYSEFNTQKICEVSVLYYDIRMKMKFENFLEKSQNDIKYLRYLNSKEKNKFRVIYRNGELYEIE